MGIALSTKADVRSRLWLPILVGGAAAGILDEIAAFVSGGSNVPRVVAAGLLGPRVIHGSGPAIWVLGVALHFFIAICAAAVYCFASVRLDFLKKHFVICGLYFGISVFVVMYLVVMPLSGLHYKGPYPLSTLLQAIGVHMALIGLPIGVARARF